MCISHVKYSVDKIEKAKDRAAHSGGEGQELSPQQLKHMFNLISTH